ncbi:MAG: hypothetical protein ABJX35_00640, partial [Hyphomicrobiales bacterium]
EAYGIVVSLSIPDGIAAVGSVLAQIFAVAQEREKAIEVLDAVTQAYDAMNDEQGLARAQQLRLMIEGNGEE